MSDMKCPFCQRELDYLAEDIYGGMYCPNCEKHDLFDNEKMWQELIRTRKALDVAVDALKDIDKTRSVANHKIGTQDKILNSGIVFCWTTPDEIHNALEQITALEQKDAK